MKQDERCFLYSSYLRFMPGPIAHLENFTEEEKIKLSSLLRTKMIFRSLIIGSLILLCTGVLVYCNIFSGNNLIQSNLGIINVVFGVVGIICGRLLLAEFMEFWSEANASQKKVVNTKITGKTAEKITLGRKSFTKQDILLDSSDFDSLKEGDVVRVELSSKSSTLFSVKRIQ